MMKTSTKTLLASAISVVALACAGGAYAQGAGGGAGAGGSAGGGGAAGAGGAGGAGGGARGGATPADNTLEQPGIQPGMGNSNTNRMGGYGTPGSTQQGSGRSSTHKMHKHHKSSTMDQNTPQQQNEPPQGNDNGQ